MTIMGLSLLRITSECTLALHDVQVVEFGKTFVRNNSMLHGRIASQDKVLPRIQCGTDCLKLKGCIGFTMRSPFCSLILIYPGSGPNAATVNLDEITEIWMKADPEYPRSCLQAKYWYERPTDGRYWIVTSGTFDPVEVYCDMTTASGGWTLVWSYGFIDYENFTDNGNAVVPIPSSGWISGLVDTTNVYNTSSVIPTDPKEHGAMEFALWARIGRQFLVRSNINNDIKCIPGTGSVVESTSGTVSCQLVTDVVQNGCTDVPIWYDVTPSVAFLATNTSLPMYLWEGNKYNNWPTHDPCGENEPNHKTGESDPGGQLYLRMSEDVDNN